MAKTPEEMEAAMVANLAHETGRALPAWIALEAQHGAAQHSELVKWLKTGHGVTHGYANLIVHYASKPPASTPNSWAGCVRPTRTRDGYRKEAM